MKQNSSGAAHSKFRREFTGRGAVSPSRVAAAHFALRRSIWSTVALSSIIATYLLRQDTRIHEDQR